jgi:membrane protein
MFLKRTWSLINYVIGEYGRDNCNQLAAAISYYVLFSIVPFTLFTVSVFGVVVGKEKLQRDVTPSIVDFVGLRQGTPTIEVDQSKVSSRLGPAVASQLATAATNLTPEEAAAIANQLKQTPSEPVAIGGRQLMPDEVHISYNNPVGNTLHSVSQRSAPLTVIGFVVLGWSSSAMFGAVRRALQAVWKVERQRPFFQQKLRDLIMTAFLGVLLLLSIGMTGLLQALRAASDRALGPLSSNTGIFWAAMPYILPFIFSFLVISLTYRYAPGVHIRLASVWPGAVLAATLFEVLKNAFAFYVAHFPAYDILYGSLGGILLFLTSVYLSAAILLLGAELTLAWPRLAAGEFDPVLDPNAPRLTFLKRASRDFYGFVRGLFLARPERTAARSRGRIQRH